MQTPSEVSEGVCSTSSPSSIRSFTSVKCEFEGHLQENEPVNQFFKEVKV